MVQIVKLQVTDSTSSYLRSRLADAPHGTTVSAHTQTAGRGQRGNSWEAEPGMNLTFSMMLRPLDLEVRSQYILSEAVATAIASTLRKYVDAPERLTIKWPNDIYYDDSKLGGILIENSLSGPRVEKSIAGVGININQTTFRSDAPNPISLKQIMRQTYEIDPLLAEITGAIAEASLRPSATLHELYLSMFWRREGNYPYREPDGEPFIASIERVAPDGMLTLRRSDGTEKTYAFKEVIALI